jgi:hypothetical protein
MKPRKKWKKSQINKKKIMNKKTRKNLMKVKMIQMEAIKMKYNNHQIMMDLMKSLGIRNKKEKLYVCLE